MRTRLIVVALVLLATAGFGWREWSRPPAPERWPGYADADYVKVAPTLQGRLIRLSVARGDTVKAGAPLFAQDDGEDRAARDQSAAELVQAREKLADLREAGRTAEVIQARADVTDMQAAYERVSLDLARNAAIVATGAVTRQTVDQLQADTRSARAKLESARARLALITDATGRAHAIAAQTAATEAATAALAGAQWRLDQRQATAPAGGLIADTMARPGETLAAGAAVVSLLPPENILVRFFVPEATLSRIHLGDTVGVACDSCPPGLTARISFVATAPEYTPPVIYSEDARASLVYLIEARPDPAARPLLKPGQPVDVRPPDVAR